MVENGLEKRTGMITKITVKSFKSLEHVEIELGQLNVFVGANGSGKSNLLEAIGVLSAAANGKVNGEALSLRGVRPGQPGLFRSAFQSEEESATASIAITASSDAASYEVELREPTGVANDAWQFATERLADAGQVLVDRHNGNLPNLSPDHGLASLKAVEWQAGTPSADFFRHLQNYVIYSPITSVLRGLDRDRPRHPLGLAGGNLAEAFDELLADARDGGLARRVVNEAQELIEWASGLGTGSDPGKPPQPVGSSPIFLLFEDKFMAKGRNRLAGESVSEGAVYVCFLAVLAALPTIPVIFAVDNADHGLNPGLAKALATRFSDWILENKQKRQVLITSHNPAVLDGLPLQDDRVRLFTVDRDNKGKTVVQRVLVTGNLLQMAAKGWTLSRLWTNKLIGGMPDV